MKRTHEMVERRLVEGLLQGDPAPGSHLQSERELAARFAVSRATVREALCKLQKAGWISVLQRHATVVNDFWSRGDFELLCSISRNSDPFPQELAAHLLELRLHFAPHYARRAVENGAAQLAGFLACHSRLRNSWGATLRFDSELHLTMAVLSGNRIYPLVMNSFAGLYLKSKRRFFEKEEHRAEARLFYGELMKAAASRDPGYAEEVTRAALMLRLERFRGQPGSA
jgi:GntR family transcriptional regulator, negative regulator for fad regulon and positive regulator of fabA